MIALDLTRARWRKSTRSADNGGACVEVARNLPGAVGIRDSKTPAGPALVIDPTTWSAFTNHVKTNNCDL